MPLTNDYERAAMLLLRAAADGALSLAGTGFAVMVDSETFGTELRHFYLVTAGHVVLGSQPVYARFRLIGGSIRDERIDNWVHHPTYDIAVAPLQDDAEVDGIAVPVATFTDEASLGDTVFFIGLLRSLAPMAEAGVPMVRSGTVGRMWQQSIPARTGVIQTELTGHLIDCRAYQGMSGAPCFVQHSFPVLVPVPGSPDPGLRTWDLRHLTVFFGMIAAHFDDYETLLTPDARDALLQGVRTRVHTGVGVVTPASFIREALDDEELLELRGEADRQEAARRSSESGNLTVSESDLELK
jgi:trypsin-like peptidase